jgi:hypothetical protein
MEFKFITALIAISFSCVTFARVDCPAAKILNIQIEGTTILYLQEGSNWHRLGLLNEEGTKERYAALLASQASGRKVVVGYARDTYDCSALNYGESALLVRTHND